MKKFIPVLSFFLLSLFFIPTFVLALDETNLKPGSLIVCSGPDCNFAKLVELFYKAINVLVAISTLVTVAVLIFGAFRLLTSNGDPGALKELRSRMKYVLYGYFFILAAFAIVHTILKVLVKDEYIYFK